MIHTIAYRDPMDNQAFGTNSDNTPTLDIEESDHAEDGQPSSATKTDTTRRRPPNRPLIALSTTAAVLAIATATMTCLYARQSHQTDERDRTIATQKAVAEKAQKRASEQGSKIEDLEAKLIDPQGYELMKKCVQVGAAAKPIQWKLMPTNSDTQLPPDIQLPPGTVYMPLAQLVGLPEGGDLIANCTEAQKYLK